MKNYQDRKMGSPRAQVVQPPKSVPKPKFAPFPMEPPLAHARAKFQVGIDTFKKAPRKF